jgi:hypothetical protein
MRIIAAAVLAAATLVGCASSDSRDRKPGPTIDIRQTTAVRPIRAAMTSAVPVDYTVAVTNPLDNPITLLSLEIETVGYSGSYSMKRVKHAFSQVIPAKGTETLAIRAWVQPLQENTRGDSVAPVNIRGFARFDSMGTTLRTVFADPVEQ